MPVLHLTPGYLYDGDELLVQLAKEQEGFFQSCPEKIERGGVNG